VWSVGALAAENFWPPNLGARAILKSIFERVKLLEKLEHRGMNE
jgi:hypothetical protein